MSNTRSQLPFSVVAGQDMKPNGVLPHGIANGLVWAISAAG